MELGFDLVHFEHIIGRTPDISGDNVKVWNIKQNETIRINLVEMSGELSLHKHPDAEHSLIVLTGRVLARVGDRMVELVKGDFISIPANVPHKYWSMTKTAMLVSMDAPYYDPKKTISLEEV
jgi:quercetin dioxygenase-like cupin family protein